MQIQWDIFQMGYFMISNFFKRNVDINQMILLSTGDDDRFTVALSMAVAYFLHDNAGSAA